MLVGALFNRRATAIWPSSLRVAALLLAYAAVIFRPVLADSPAASAPSIVCLHTEFLPYKEDEALKYRLMRELGRQAVLIAARDELGLHTRDETLDEVFPESVKDAKQDVFVSVRTQYDGSVRFQLWLASKPEDLLPTKKEHQHDPNVILNLTKSLEAMSRKDLCDKLRGLGFDGKAKSVNEANQPSDDFEGQLLEMNFVSQFAAVRASHAAIAEKGQSSAWLGALARGYANLALMTEYHWKSDTEVFATRALLYAERLVVAYPNDPLAHATRSYVWALVGLHGPALEELTHVEELRTRQTSPVAMPGWFELIKPYCSFEREPVTAVVAQRKSLRELAQRLAFEQTGAFANERWTLDSAREAMRICPEEYGVYAALTKHINWMTASRTGSYYAPVAMKQFLPPRVAKLEGLPEAVRRAATGATDTDKKEGDSSDDGKNDLEKEQPAPSTASAGGYAAATVPIVEALRAATRSGDDKGEPSWSALGELIFEEQFVQAANYLRISMNATESSHDDIVNSILPAIKGHRYIRYIESYADGPMHNGKTFAETIGDMQVVDPRGNMEAMISRIWYLDDGTGKQRRGSRASWAALFDRSITFPGMLEAYMAFSDTWWSSLDAEMRQRFANDFKILSPHSPQALQLKIDGAENATYEDVAQWEAEAGEDPWAYSKIGEWYSYLKHYDDAVRAFEHSITLSPTESAYVGLADAYRDSGQEELWQPTLERFLKVEPLGLENAKVHQLIANDLIDKGKLDEALPHALAAAETWAAWGLELASRVEEGLGHWDESEKWIREEAQAYPTGAADKWYLWCRRTGRGDISEATKLAQPYFNAERLRTYLDGRRKLLTYHLCENSTTDALDDA
ncbi:MAG TPA: hypothetical protein VHU84_13860, partial [Lacipirellulaceae bacterium]|nr:hypothetical protein [Lacipirellulaceae bacterium]